RGAARGARARALSRNALCGDREDPGDLRRRRQDPHLPGRRDLEGPFFRGRKLMDCRDVTTLGIERITGEAPEAARRELAAHLAGCESCRREMARLEDAWTTLGLDPDAEVTPDFRRRTLGLLEDELIRGRVRAFRPPVGF